MVCHSSGITFPFNSYWQSSIITLVPTSTLAYITSAHASEGPAAIFGFITIAIFSQIAFVMDCTAILASVM